MAGGARIALGVAAGYLLGRSKKMRLALMLAAAGATGRLGTPADLAQRGMKALASSPEVAKMAENLRGELADALKGAAVAAASGRIDALTDRLQESAVGKPAEAVSGTAKAATGVPAEAAEELRGRLRGRGREAAEEDREGAAEDVAGGEEEAEEQREPSVARQRRAPAEETTVRRSPRHSRDEPPHEDERVGPRRRTAMGAGGGRAPIRRTRR